MWCTTTDKRYMYLTQCRYWSSFFLVDASYSLKLCNVRSYSYPFIAFLSLKGLGYAILGNFVNYDEL